MAFNFIAPICVHSFTVNDFNLRMQAESVLPVCREHTVGTLWTVSFSLFLAGFSTAFSKSKVLLDAWEGVFEEAKPTAYHAGAQCRKRSDSHTTNNLNRFLMAVEASFLPGKTELFNYYLSSNKTKLKSFVLELVCFTGRNHHVTKKLLVYIGCKHHAELLSFFTAVFRVATQLQIWKDTLVLGLK